MMSLSFGRLMDNPLMNEKTSFEFEHLGADVADEAKVTVNAPQV